MEVVLQTNSPKSPLPRIMEILEEWDARDHRGDGSHRSRRGDGQRGRALDERIEIVRNHHLKVPMKLKVLKMNEIESKTRNEEQTEKLS